MLGLQKRLTTDDEEGVLILQQKSVKQFTAALTETIKNKNQTAFKELIENLQPYDHAQLYHQVPNKYKQDFILYLSKGQLTEILPLEFQH